MPFLALCSCHAAASRWRWQAVAVAIVRLARVYIIRSPPPPLPFPPPTNRTVVSSPVEFARLVQPPSPIATAQLRRFLVHPPSSFSPSLTAGIDHAPPSSSPEPAELCCRALHAARLSGAPRRHPTHVLAPPNRHEACRPAASTYTTTDAREQPVAVAERRRRAISLRPVTTAPPLLHPPCLSSRGELLEDETRVGWVLRDP